MGDTRQEEMGAFAQKLKVQDLLKQAEQHSGEALASLAADDLYEADRHDILADAKRIEADEVGGSPNLTPSENQQLQDLSARFYKYMDDGETEPGGLTIPEYERLSYLLEKAGSVEREKDSRK